MFNLNYYINKSYWYIYFIILYKKKNTFDHKQGFWGMRKYGNTLNKFEMKAIRFCLSNKAIWSNLYGVLWIEYNKYAFFVTFLL